MLKAEGRGWAMRECSEEVRFAGPTREPSRMVPIVAVRSKDFVREFVNVDIAERQEATAVL